MEYTDINLVEEEGISVIYFNREKQLNTITGHMVDEIIRAMKSVSNSCRSIIIGGRNNFSAGADVAQFQNIDTRSAYEFHIKLNELALFFRSYPRPVISFLNGYVLGGGLELSLSTDIRICSENAILGQPEINLGINAGAGGNVVLPSVIGRNRALYMILTGEKITASQAYDFGLVDLLSDNSELEARRIATLINRMPEETVSTAKRTVNNVASNGLEMKLDYEAALFGILQSEKYTKERIDRFMQKKGKQ
ncbi:enoyl-CoA hydratase/isomerase family protein [Ferroplasma sp.]|uniref:enoyl-CoA hydratase/isomerase family protein n=1 Tax=Ferroplasma sp. TaxID=2591003 RepID=UPI002635B673|nr:enoyl-CoA hydratase/isomerase family protein [Ferroplasma sp.]MCL4453797.1 enoyl-CoA hydratase/isomerase family protein [Candidatus Thermoplasmatota archaeon]